MEETEITETVGVLQEGKVGVPSGMRAEDLKGWLQEATLEKKYVMYRWAKLVRIIQLAFAEG